MSDVAFKVGMACLSGAYLAANLVILYSLISQQKARMQKEAGRDHFYDKYQEVIDLTCLTNLNIESAKKALLDDKFKTPVSEKIVEALTQTDDPGWQKIYLERKTLKASYDDLMMIQAALKEKKMPYSTVRRGNPVRAKTGDGSNSTQSVAKGHVHEDLRRHWQYQLGAHQRT